MKDNFSDGSHQYLKYRPVYPAAVYKFIEDLVKNKERAWDCGTGNGQVAVELSHFFSKVEATDISGNQLENATRRSNITYSLQPAEKTDFPNAFFDLVTVGQAVHWFNFEKFYKEVKRCLKPQGLLFIMGYGLFRSNTETDEVINYFYKDLIGPYWDEERRYLDEEYNTIPFPFKEILSPKFEQEVKWTLEHLEGYLRTWSAVKHYMRREGKDPVALISKDLKSSFGKSGRIRFPIFTKIGSAK